MLKRSGYVDLPNFGTGPTMLKTLLFHLKTGILIR
jgi:hypothetical protein